MWCTVVRHDVPMPAQRVHTKEYAAEDRERLGLAVTRAREASGHPYRPSFAKAAGLSVRSIVNLETGKPVGPVVYEAAARLLPGWTEDTPREILDGGAVPDLVIRPDHRVSPVLTATPDDPRFWIALRDEVRPEQFEELWKLYLEKREARRLLAERDFKEGHPSNG